MTKAQQFDLIVMQLFIGFAAALIGGMSFFTIDGYLAHFELFIEMLYAICTAYGGMLVGIGVVGFRYLKQAGRQ